MSTMIKVKVLFFASARELAEVSHATMELPAGSTCSALRQALACDFPLLGLTVMDVTLAINEAYVAVNTDPTLADGDEVALIPPISGG
ncbi:hypothetical protein M885DRAFT_460788 [Pelagophyceae sp. CCMP2097]|nr:hypothetical protein M885DRAFT_460788 [Pelagophyceae sp. CCMP2097]